MHLGVRIKNEIGALFRDINILEYKSPGAALNAGMFYKTLGYVCRYLYERGDHNEKPAGSYAMLFVRESMPESMILSLGNDGISVTEYTSGIYEIKGPIPFSAWLIVTDKLDKKHVWLKALTKSGSRENLDGIVEQTRGKEDRHKEYADNVMNVFTLANNELVRTTIKEENNMCEAVEELFADKIDYLLNRVGEVQGMLNDVETKLNKTENKLSKTEAAFRREKARADAAEAKLRAAGLA